MADPKELDFGQMMQSDPDYLEQERKRAIAQAMATATLKGQPTGGEFRRSPFAVLADYMALKNNRGAIQSVNQNEADLYRKHKDIESAGVRDLIDAQASNDPDKYKAALSNAIASQYPNLKRLGENLAKGEEGTFKSVVDAMKDRIDPASAIGSRGMTSRLKVNPPLAPPNLRSVTGPNGNPVSWIEAPQLNGETGVHTLPVGASATVNMGDKPALETEEQMGKYYAAGGKGFEQGQTLHRQLQSTQDMIRTVLENPQMGSGAEAMQGFRKLAETLSPGISNGLSANTEQAKMQLMTNVIEKLGGLGRQISDEDRKAMVSALGSLESDPTALRRILTISMKYQMRQLAELGQGAQDTENMDVFARRGTKLSKPYMFNVEMPGGIDPFATPQQSTPAPMRVPRVGPSASGLPPGVRPK